MKGTYVSSDDCERFLAYRFGYQNVYQHPQEIGAMEPDEILVIDFDHVLFDDKDLAIMRANAAANRGMLVGIHTYYRGDPRLIRFRALPNVIVAKTHRRVMALLRRRTRTQGRQPAGVIRRPQPKSEEDIHVRKESA